MGYMFAYGPCFNCGRLFSFNPYTVPSHQGQPVCKDCMDLVNRRRTEEGLPPHPVPADAYEPVEE